jgi:hypothetical protein
MSQEANGQVCPICCEEVLPNSLHPRYACAACVRKAEDEEGRRLAFFNVKLTGGLVGIYYDTGEERKDRVCYIEGVKCIAEEGQFGGVMICAEDGDSNS